MINQLDLAKEFRVEVDELRGLFQKLSTEGYDQMGPVFRDGAIMLEKLSSFDDLAVGYLEEQDKGCYQLTHHEDQGYFQYSVGPQSFKKFLHPPRRKLWSADGSKEAFEISVPEGPPKMVFWGVRNCDLAAIKILDEVFLKGPFVNEWYQAAREALMIIAVGCTHPSQNCFCTTMDSGPMPEADYDLRLIEFKDVDEHYFVTTSNSPEMDDWLKSINVAEASDKAIANAKAAMESSVSKMPKRLDSSEASQLLKDNLESPEWEKVANRCLSCANCTLVCPTCFCTTTEDVTDITGEHTERWLTWDSCFVGDFSYIHGGQVRPSTRSRYRQWMTHKLSNWYDQFGSSGCVGCGRCVAWCPVGIDITEELLALKETSAGTNSQTKVKSK